jgi:NAD(P)-dependent dehydrogenase (short-subunit alcohol dehydrogenase family)
VTELLANAVTNALRMELRPWGVHVVLVEPGATKSDAPGKLVASGRRAASESFSGAGRADYGDTFRQVIERIASGHDRQGSPPEVIAQAVARAMNDRRPRTRYPVGGHAKLLTRLARIAPDRALDALFLRMLGFPREIGARSAGAQGTRAR